MRLELLELQVRRQRGALMPQIQAALAPHGEPLRWAITAVQHDPAGAILQIEAVMVQGHPPRPQVAASR